MMSTSGTASEIQPTPVEGNSGICGDLLRGISAIMTALRSVEEIHR
jgi:hypothetical protein